MSWLSKAVRRNKKFLRGAVKKAASVATGGLSDKAISLGKAIGQNVSSRKLAEKVARIPKPQYDMLQEKTRLSSGAVNNQPMAMPGGAPLRKAAKKRRSPAKKAKKATRKAKTPKVKSKRKAPSGGLNLKAIAAEWRAAGKPGKWIDFVKSKR